MSQADGHGHGTFPEDPHEDRAAALSQGGANADFARSPVHGMGHQREEAEAGEPGGLGYAMVFQLSHERWSAVLNTLDEHPAARLTTVGLVAGIICLLLARHISKPLVHLRAVVAEMASGNLDARAGSGAADRVKTPPKS